MTESFISLNFDDEKKRLTMLTNLCRMLVRRGNLSFEKYKLTKDKKEYENPTLVPPNNTIDNDLFLPFIKKRDDTYTYTIMLDTPFKDERQDSTDYNGSTLIVKIIPQVIKDIGSSSVVLDFLKLYNKNKKIIIFDGMSDKVHNLLSKKKNLEVFDKDYLMIDLMSMIFAPINCSLVTSNEIAHIIAPKLPKIYENDPLVRYYNGKKNGIIKIIRPSLNNSIETVYKKIIEFRSVF
jgi:hypothetical protein